MSIKIGNDNKFKNSNVIEGNNNSSGSSDGDNGNSFASKHPILIGIMCSVIASVIMMFKFWEPISNCLKKLF